jgi:hypothetical protein
MCRRKPVPRLGVEAIFARVATALCLAAVAWAGNARADDPACAQYREPMAYNQCLAQHGPKANGVGKLHGGPQSGHAVRIGVGTGRLAAGRRPRACTLLRAFSVPRAVCIWSFASNERGQKLTSATPEPAEIAQAPRSSPRAVGDQHEVRTSRQAPRRNGAGSGSRWGSLLGDPTLLIRAAEHSTRCFLFIRLRGRWL